MKKALIFGLLILLIVISYLFFVDYKEQKQTKKDNYTEYVMERYGEYYLDEYLRHKYTLKESGITEKDIQNHMKINALSYEDAMLELIIPYLEGDLYIDYSREYFVIVGKYEGFYEEDVWSDIEKNGIHSEFIQGIEVKELGETITDGVEAVYSLVKKTGNGIIVTGDQLTNDSSEQEKDIVLKAKIKKMIEGDKWFNDLIEKHDIDRSEYTKG